MQQLTYTFKELCHGPRWIVIEGGLFSLHQAEVYALSWLKANGYTIIDQETDVENSAIDFMAAKGNALYQYAVERG